ncbi:MAG: hypothetical protein WC520_00485 [Candidatus Paceibacterota bacterium]
MNSSITAVTDGQKKQVKRFTEDAVDYVFAGNYLDKDSVQRLIEKGDLFQEGFTNLVRRLSASQYQWPARELEYGNDSVYERVKDVSDQIEILQKCFPNIELSANMELLKRPLPTNAEGLFAIPCWQLIADAYEEAVQEVFDLIRIQRKEGPYNGFVQGIRSSRLKQRSVVEQAFKKMREQQKGFNTLLVPAQFGILYRDYYLAEASGGFRRKEFGLDVFSIGIMLLTHPERLKRSNNLPIACCGDVYFLKMHGDDPVYSGVPLFAVSSDNVKYYLSLSLNSEKMVFSVGVPTGFFW